MYKPLATPLLLLLLVLALGCSGTVLNNSWKNPEYNSKLESVYIICISKEGTTRRSFEDSFNNNLAEAGIVGYVSYRDFPDIGKADKDQVLDKTKAHNASSILVTRLISKNTETVVNPGRTTTYAYGSRYSPTPYYRNYNTYYPRRYETIYEPATVTQYDIATIEANIYDTANGELIWGAQLEMTIEGNQQTMLRDFIKVVTKDLKSKGLI